MQVYKYDEITKEFMSVETAHLDPLETELQGKEIFLLPANATFVEPTFKDGYASVWNGKAWEQVEDNRNKEYWLDSDPYGTPARVMKELGAFPDNAVFTAPVKPLEMVKEEKIAELKFMRDSLEVEPIEYNGNLFDYDEKARERLRNKRQEIEDKGGTGTIPWTLADNTEVVIGLQDFIGINNAATERAELLHFKYRTLREQVDNATTVEEVNAIEW